MPLLSSGTHVRTIVATVAVAIGSALAPAVASAACTPAPTTKAFATWGDTADYAAAPAGGFETSGWTLLNGARVVEGNDPSDVTTGRRSLLLPRTGIAVSPRFCVDDADATFRFMARAGFWYSTYQALVIYRDDLGAVTQTRFVSSQDTTIIPGAWKPSGVGARAAGVPVAAGGATSVQLMLRADEGSTQFDSVMVAPHGRG